METLIVMQRAHPQVPEAQHRRRHQHHPIGYPLQDLAAGRPLTAQSASRVPVFSLSKNLLLLKRVWLLSHCSS
ncbi:hypothetical protein A4R35_06365 [Thermogemmatispora tikiterensis]|uniref:Uncharacterized protein n=1 Tax=Thermogemmatispora tikiterensis TaxID=1825093 RepID=A0A328VGE8_9CHLR|nr:hypothetical protein A4R35_06365 [Thermogemmatispora tikiterensis]